MGKDLISLITLAMLALAGCVADGEKKVQPKLIEEPELPSYSYKMGAPRLEKDPLPNLQPVYITNNLPSETAEPQLGYRGWDFDKNGRIDMLEIIDLNGNQVSSVFDFNGDGKLDLMRRGGELFYDQSEFTQLNRMLVK